MLNWDKRALEVLDVLRKNGHRAVLVGGCVRDSLLSIPLHDYDGATSALPEEMKRACAQFHCVETGIKHGTLTVISGGLPVEVTTFRQESGYSDHRRPDRVEFTDSLTADLARRDFTVNAIAWEPEGITDPFGGQEDLKNHLIRCVGDPDQRFEEDALRVIRGLRLAAQLGFDLHPDTAAAIRRHAEDLSLVAWERISAEFLRLICSPGAVQILLDFPEIVTQILPELKPAVGFDQKTWHHIYDIYTHSVKALELVPPVPALRLAALLHDVGKPSVFSTDENGQGHFYNHVPKSVELAGTALTRMKLDKATRSKVLLLIERHHLPVEATNCWVGKWLSRLGQENFFDLLALKRADSGASAYHPGEAERFDAIEALAREHLAAAPCLTLKDLAVNGRDAVAAGLTGPEIGQRLHSLLEQVAEGSLPNDRETLLPYLK